MSADDYDCLKLENQLCFPLYVCSKEIVSRYRPYLEPLGLTYTQYIAMMALWEKDGMTVMDLGKALYLDSGTLSPLLRKLESKGFVERNRNPSDERSVIVKVTEEGWGLREKLKDVPGSVGSCIDISKDDALALYRILNSIMSKCESPRD